MFLVEIERGRVSDLGILPADAAEDSRLGTRFMLALSAMSAILFDLGLMLLGFNDTGLDRRPKPVEEYLTLAII